MKIGNREFDIKNRTYIMGILNITPDSFYDGGKWNQRDKALYHAEDMIKEGADIIDIGGESTRPGHSQISCEEELSRILPILEAIKHNFDIPISIDTYKSQVAEVALSHGACLVNDIWGLKYDQELAPIIAKYGAACCLVHNRDRQQSSTPTPTVTPELLPNRLTPGQKGDIQQSNTAKLETVSATLPIRQNGLLTDILKEMQVSLDLAKEGGIPEEKIMIDPGLGFGKTYEMNLHILNQLEKFMQLGYPVLLGASRKGFIGKTLDLPADQRVEGALATTALAVMKGCAFVRVHDIKENKRVIQMTEAILGKGESHG